MSREKSLPGLFESIRQNFRLFSLAGLGLAAALAWVSCTKKTSIPAGGGEVNIAIWSNYLSPDIRERFTKETGLRLNILTYSSNDELLAKVQAGGSGLDLAVPSDYMVDVMIKLGLLDTFDRKDIPAAANLDPAFLGRPFDPDNSHSLPYAWSTTGIAVNRDLYKKPISSWKDLMENPELKGKFSLLDDGREAMAAVLKMDGQSVNTVDTAALERAKTRLLKIRESAKMFTSDAIDILKNKEVIAAQTYSTDALQASAATGGKIEFILPTEGGTRAIDNLVILKGAKNKTGALKLIDFLLRKENNVEFVKIIRAGPVVTGVRALLPPDLKDDSALFPPPQVLSKLEYMIDLGEKNRIYEDIWSAVKTGH